MIEAVSSFRVDLEPTDVACLEPLGVQQRTVIDQRVRGPYGKQCGGQAGEVGIQR